MFFIFSKLLNFIKKDIASNDLISDTTISSSWTLTSEATWRSEVVAFYFADIWLNCNVFTVSIFAAFICIVQCKILQ